MRLATAALLACASLFGQDVVSVRAGLLHYLEGEVMLDGKPVADTPRQKLFSRFDEVKEQSVLATREGRVELLLAPGVVLRLGEDSSIRMLSNKLTATRLELSSGRAVLTVDDLLKDASPVLLVRDAAIRPLRTGVYAVSAAEPAELMVYDGQAEVSAGGAKKTVKRGVAQSLDQPELARKFDVETGDALLRWARRRAGYLAMANVSAAKSAVDAGYDLTSSLWRWNPYFGMFTYLPYRGAACNSFFGYCYYSPQRIYAAIYQPAPVFGGGSTGGFGGPRYGYNPDLGYTTSSQRTYADYSPPAAASPAPAVSGPAPSPRSSEGAVGRGGEGGGRSQ